MEVMGGKLPCKIFKHTHGLTEVEELGRTPLAKDAGEELTTGEQLLSDAKTTYKYIGIFSTLETNKIWAPLGLGIEVRASSEM